MNQVPQPFLKYRRPRGGWRKAPSPPPVGGAWVLGELVAVSALVRNEDGGMAYIVSLSAKGPRRPTDREINMVRRDFSLTLAPEVDNEDATATTRFVMLKAGTP